MEMRLITGGRRDHLELTAQSPAECVAMVRVALSQFIPPDLMMLDASNEYSLRLLIWLSEERRQTPEQRAEVNDAHDQEP